VFRGTIHEIEESGQELSDRTKTLYAATLDPLQGLKAAKAYGADQRNAEIFSALSSSVARANLESARRQAAASSWFELGSVLILAVVLYVSIRVLRVPSAEILILLLLFARVMPRFLSAHNHQRGFVNALPSFANVLSLEHRCLAAAEPPASAHPRLPLRRDISFVQVSFSYQPGAPPALHHLDLVVPAGKIVALVGPSGAGKSTVADLMMGLLVPDSGSVAIDGAALGVELARAWREQVGFVAADTFLFHDTIRENLRWASPAASEPEMRAALELAAAEFVFALPGGLETIVGDRGILLSHGERQRLALARAFLRRPSMLILDEATNSLDSENETRVFGAIERLRGEMTVLLIAHRLSTIRWAELIYVIEEGTIVESGDWSALSAKRDGRFRALWEAQSLAL
jgi:ATP-binding cassette, subfamily C, bacterial